MILGKKQLMSQVARIDQVSVFVVDLMVYWLANMDEQGEETTVPMRVVDKLMVSIGYSCLEGGLGGGTSQAGAGLSADNQFHVLLVLQLVL